MQVERDLFFEKIDKFKYIPLFQSIGYYYEKYKPSKRYVYFLDNIDDTTLGCYGEEIRIPIIGTLLRINSIAYLDGNVENLAQFLNEIKNCDKYKIIDIIDDNIYNVETEKIFRESGFRRPLSQWGTSLTIMVDTKDIKPYNKDWKKNIKSAEKNSNLKFECVNALSDDILDKVSILFKENSENKGLTYCYQKEDLINLLSDKKNQLYIVLLNNEIIAARVIFINKTIAIDVCTANGNKSRDIRGTTQYLCHNIFEDLRVRGVEYFDFSRIPIGRKGAEGVALFKLGSRGNLVQYNGHWQYTRKPVYRYLMFLLYKFILKKYEY